MIGTRVETCPIDQEPFLNRMSYVSHRAVPSHSIVPFCLTKADSVGALPAIYFFSRINGLPRSFVIEYAFKRQTLVSTGFRLAHWSEAIEPTKSEGWVVFLY